MIAVIASQIIVYNHIIMQIKLILMYDNIKNHKTF